MEKNEIFEFIKSSVKEKYGKDLLFNIQMSVFTLEDEAVEETKEKEVFEDLKKILDKYKVTLQPALSLFNDKGEFETNTKEITEKLEKLFKKHKVRIKPFNLKLVLKDIEK